MDIKLYKEELELLMIIYQRISKEIVLNEFNVIDPAILSAIECHTTLKEEYSGLGLVVFVADKIKWNRKANHRSLLNLWLR